MIAGFMIIVTVLIHIKGMDNVPLLSLDIINNNLFKNPKKKL